MGILALILLILAVFFFIKWIKLLRFNRRLGDYYELLYSYDTRHVLLFCVISPVRCVRPRSEYSGFTGKVYFTDLAAAEAERDRLIARSRELQPAASSASISANSNNSNFMR